MELSNILLSRAYYKPFDYPEAYEYWLIQQSSFWIHTEINMDADIYDWRFNLTASEKRIIGSILKSFVQSEILIGDYWRKIAGIFPVPEINMMCASFSAMESNHIAAYAYLNDSLGISDWKEFLTDDVVITRLAQLANPPQPYDGTRVSFDVWRRNLARSLAVFSAFGEGVALFSAFTILLSFTQRGLMRGLGEIIEMSIRDEVSHSKAGMWLYNTFMKENKDLHDVKKGIYEAGRLTVAIEDCFINSVFELDTLPNCNPDDLKEFIRQRMNTQLKTLRLKPEYRIDKAKVDNLKWFNLASSGDQHADFFSSRVTTYAKSSGWDKLWER